jgi:predicted P-loop ATPase
MSEQNKFDFKYENTLVYGRRSRCGQESANGPSEPSQNIRDEIKRDRKTNVYIKTSEFDGRGHNIKDENVKQIRCWWSEGDKPSGSRSEQVEKLKELEKYGLKFSAVVDSGGKSIHTFIRKPIGITIKWEDDVRIMRKIAVLINGDTSVITKSQCMRIPGFNRPEAESQKLLWGQVDIPFSSVEEIEEVLDKILKSQGIANWALEYRNLTLKDAKKQSKQFAGGGEHADQWEKYEVRPQDQILAKRFRTIVDIKEFVPKDVKNMLKQGSLKGERNNDGLKVTLALAGAARILEEIGLVLERPIDVTLEDFAEASGEDFDLVRLKNQYAGAIEGEVVPSRPVESFMKTLNYVTGGMFGNQEIKIDLESQKGGMDGLLESIGPWKRIDNDESNDISPPQLNAGMTADLIQNAVADKLQFNDLTKQIEFCSERIPPDRVELGYVELQQLRRYCTKTTWTDSLLMVSYKNRFDPISDYLTNIEYADDIEPVDLNSLATTYLGTDNALYDRMLKVAVLGAVKRRLDPGCQFDSVVVLHGKQGIKKSTFWKTLASPPYFCDTAPEDSKDFTMNIHNCWIFELGELDHITGQKDAGRLKSVITSAIDTIRLPYAKNIETKPRSSIFVGSSNRDDFLKDQTGNRRFLIIPCTQDPAKGEFIDIKKLSKDRDKIWKAGINAYRMGEKPYLEWEMQLESEEQNKSFRDEHPWGEVIQRWLATNKKNEVTTEELMNYALEISVDRQTMVYKKIVAEQLREQGWIQSKNPKQHGCTRKRTWTKIAQV